MWIVSAKSSKALEKTSSWMAVGLGSTITLILPNSASLVGVLGKLGFVAVLLFLTAALVLTAWARHLCGVLGFVYAETKEILQAIPSSSNLYGGVLDRDIVTEVGQRSSEPFHWPLKVLVRFFTRQPKFVGHAGLARMYSQITCSLLFALTALVLSVLSAIIGTLLTPAVQPAMATAQATMVPQVAGPPTLTLPSVTPISSPTQEPAIKPEPANELKATSKAD